MTHKSTGWIAVAFALSVFAGRGVSAAILIGEEGKFLTTEAELFLAVYDSATGASYTRDLGIDALTANFSTAEFEFAPDGLYLSTFGASDPSDLRYSIVTAINDSLDFMEASTWTTSNDANVSFPTDPLLTLSMIAIGIQNYVIAVNESIPTTDPFEDLSTVILDSASPGHYTNPSTFNESLASTVVFNTGASLGAPLAFHVLYYNFVVDVSGVFTYPNLWTLATDGTLSYAPPSTTDTDTDGVFDTIDNCTEVSNPNQVDSDGDGFGNVCDTDLSGDCVTNAVDLGLFKQVFFTADPDADFNLDGVVSAVDLGIFRSQFLREPGPSALASCD